MADAASGEATTAKSSREHHHDRSSSTSSTSRNRPQRSPSPALSQAPKRSRTAPLASAPSPVTASPKTSREPSPARTALKLQPTTSRLTRSRKNSQDLSPHRGPNSTPHNLPDTPSAAAIQRAIAAAGTGRLPSPNSSEFPNDVQRPQKSKRAHNQANRLTSPPRSATIPRPTLPKHDLEPPITPSIIVNQPTPKSASSFDDIEEEEEGDMLRIGIRSPVRAAEGSTLEAVRESTDTETPAITASNKPPLGRLPSASRSATIAETIMEDQPRSGVTSPDSGSESAGGKSVRSNGGLEKKGESKKGPSVQSAPKPNISTRRSLSQLNSSKNKATGDGSLRNMTVETETVSSVPQTTVGAPLENRNTSGKVDPATVRLKASAETIRPRRDKKRNSRKAHSTNPGTASSKADIFEAKVKSAVEEANSSDSEETFVYESNPPEPMIRPSHVHHSRTPSMTSIASQNDHFRARLRSEGNNSVAAKKSMKFANSAKNMQSYALDNDDASSVGTPISARSNAANGSQQFARHIGRHGRTPGHLSILDNDAPFQNTPRSPRKANTGSFSRRTSPHPHLQTPRSPNMRMPLTAKSYAYEIDADDERTPLMPTARSQRGRRRSFAPHEELYYEEEQRTSWRGVGACVLLGGLVTVLVAAIVIAVVLCSKPLINVEIEKISGVLASDQELIFDLKVRAINPNIVGVQISNSDLMVLARSKYVGTSKYWRNQPRVSDKSDLRDANQIDAPSGYKAADNVDEGTDPIVEDPHVMLLGKIYRFDSPLSFDATPFHTGYLSSIGEVRLDHPGNNTEQGGLDRWEAVMQHDFELIIRGVLKYSLPISSRLFAPAIYGKILVHPEQAPAPETPSDGSKNKTIDGEVGITKSRLRRLVPVAWEAPRKIFGVAFSA